MVFGTICEHASRAFIFASKSSCQISLASSEHLSVMLVMELRAFSRLYCSETNADS